MTDLNKVAEAIYARMNDRLKLDSGYLPKSLDKYREYAADLAQAAMDAMGGWRPIDEARKDHTRYLMLFRSDLHTIREDLRRWNGVQAVCHHNGLAYSFDIGWSISAPVGNGGFPDSWFVGFRRLPPAPKEEA